jgi:hypothetical protein
MIYRNLLYNTENDIESVLKEGGEDFLKQIESKLSSKNLGITV